MSIRSSIALSLVVALSVGSMPGLIAAAPQVQGNGIGIIGGKAGDEARKPYTDYKVQLRDIGTSQIVSSVPLDAQGKFTFNNLALARRYLVELYNIPKNKIVCTEGPYALSTSVIAKTDVDIACGGNPAAWWILAAGGAAAAIAIGVKSPNAG